MMTFIATTSDKMNSIGIKDGQLIFSRDDRVIYLDAENKRNTFQQIITFALEEQRKGATNPVKGFYFVQETCVLWEYTGEWRQITLPPEETIIFEKDGDLPQTGVENKLYVDSETIYQWNDSDKAYKELCLPRWDAFSK